MADEFDILLNGSPTNGPIVMESNSSNVTQLILSYRAGSVGAGKLVKIATSALAHISAVNGNLDSNGQFPLNIGPGFALRGDLNLSIKVGTKVRSLDIQFV